MKLLNSVYDFFRFLISTELSVSLFSIIIISIIIGSFLLAGHYKQGLTLSFFCVFIWVYLAYYKHFLILFNNSTLGMAVYGIAGALLVGIIILRIVSTDT
jgi:hypothetical protein